MTREVSAELLVLRKRAATWILLAIWTFLGIFFAYVVPYALDPEDAPGASGEGMEDVIHGLFIHYVPGVLPPSDEELVAPE